MRRFRFIGNLNVAAETGNVQSGWDILVAKLSLVPQDTDLPIMVIKGTSFCPELILETIS